MMVHLMEAPKGSLAAHLAAVKANENRKKKQLPPPEVIQPETQPEPLGYLNTEMMVDAFEHIPDEIWNGDNKHTQPYPGDHGIQFEPLNESTPA